MPKIIKTIKTIRKSKKGISLNYISGMIISIILLILIISFITSKIEDSKYETSILSCQTILKNIEGKQAFFTDKLNEPTLKLENAIVNSCPSKSISIKDTTTKQAAELINNCWREGAYGVDFMGASVEDLGIAIYCGKIEAKEDIPNFSEELSEALKNKKYDTLKEQKTTSKNLNQQFLSKESLPKSISEGETITVFYYIAKPPIKSTKQNIINYLSKTFGDLTSVTSNINYYASENTLDTYTGIILSKPFKYSEEEFANIQSTISKENCKILVPATENSY